MIPSTIEELKKELENKTMFPLEIMSDDFHKDDVLIISGLKVKHEIKISLRTYNDGRPFISVSGQSKYESEGWVGYGSPCNDIEAVIRNILYGYRLYGYEAPTSRAPRIEQLSIFDL